MIAVLSREQSRAFDARMIGELAVPGLVLMENAGRGVVDAIERHWPARSLARERVVVVCGPGNNGGDGFVIARHLAVRGAEVRVLVVGKLAAYTGDASVQLHALAGVGLVASEVGTDSADRSPGWTAQPGEVAGLQAELSHATLVVDALFGTGLSRPIAGLHASVLEAVQRCERPIVAVDVPSGLDADTGGVLGVALSADLTVTFVAPKLGLLTPRGARLAGKLVVAAIGVPPPRTPASARLLERADVVSLLSRRASDMHKNAAGHVVVFAGSPGHLGAAVMCAHGAMRAGAGLVTIATWTEVADALDVRVVEVMTARLSRESLDASVDDALARADSVVIGPGFGKDAHARQVVHRVLSTWKGPLVVDADAIAMFAGAAEVFASSSASVVLTPHPGELGVLLGSSAREIEGDRFGALAASVRRTRAVTLLKGAHTLVGAPGECPVVNGSGTSALATAGAGDILSGTIGALAGTLSPFEAAFVGAYLHGAAAESWGRDRAHADRGLLAHEIAEEYPRLLGELTEESAATRQTREAAGREKR